VAGHFNYSGEVKAAFEGWCVQLLISAYRESLTKNSIKLDWEENDITEQLHEYIDRNQLRIDKHISSNVEYRMVNSILPKNKGYADKCPRIDMQFGFFRSRFEYKYYAEAKILKEHDSKLKRRYITTGIDNFLCERYYDGCLIAYIMDGDVINIVNGLNKLLIKDKRDSEVLTKKENKIYEKYYESSHNPIGILKHFMFDFTKNENSYANTL
jgi:adenylate kinase family enzyme